MGPENPEIIFSDTNVFGWAVPQHRLVPRPPDSSIVPLFDVVTQCVQVKYKKRPDIQARSRPFCTQLSHTTGLP